MTLHAILTSIVTFIISSDTDIILIAPLIFFFAGLKNKHGRQSKKGKKEY
jgi:hypothetical protein